jgi:hypothetical protein
MFLWGMSTVSWAGLVRMLAMSGEVNQACGLPIRFGGYQAGKNSGQRHKTVPDLILTNSQNEIRAVGEGKTFWTKDLAAVQRPLLASWLGKPYRILTFQA